MRLCGSMRKLISFLAVLVLLFCLTPGTAAAQSSGSSSTNKSQSIDVTAKCTTETITPVSYSVDIVWTDMTFTYTKTQTRTWNADKHSYKASAVKGSWDNKQATVTVTNHSNVDIKVTMEFIPVEGTGITGVLKNRTGKLEAGKLDDYDGADSMTATLTIKGTPSEAVTAEGTLIGSIKITIQ